jgi:hypothetical protein
MRRPRWGSCGARASGGRAAVAQHDGGGAQLQRLPAAPGGQAQAPKKVPQADALSANLRDKDGQGIGGGTVKRLSMDCKATTVNLGEYSCGGKTRGDDHDMGCRKSVSLSKEAMRKVEARLERNPLLPKWDILIRPA